MWPRYVKSWLSKSSFAPKLIFDRSYVRWYPQPRLQTTDFVIMFQISTLRSLAWGYCLHVTYQMPRFKMFQHRIESRDRRRFIVFTMTTTWKNSYLARDGPSPREKSAHSQSWETVRGIGGSGNMSGEIPAAAACKARITGLGCK